MNKISTFVAGYREVTTTDRKQREVKSIAVIIKDAVDKNPMMAAKKATKTGSLWISKGFTMEDVKEQYPYGTPIVGYEWGAEVQSEFGGIYKLQPLEDVVEEEVEKD